MSYQSLLDRALELAPDDRRALAAAILDSVGSAGGESSEAPFSDEEWRELDRLRAAAKAHPEQSLTTEEVERRVRAVLDDVRASRLSDAGSSPEAAAQPALTPAQSADLGRRAAERECHPGRGKPWDIVVREILQKRGELHLLSRVPGTATPTGE